MANCRECGGHNWQPAAANPPIPEPETDDGTADAAAESGAVSDTHAVLEKVAAAAGGRLIVEERRPSLGVLPIPSKGFANAKCPDCGGEAFWYEYGDIYCRCDGCGGQFDAHDLMADAAEIDRWP
jgi:ribosomal protein S27E